VLHQVTQHQNFSTPHYVFACADPCKSFLSASTTILSLQLPSQSIEVVVRQALHQVTENPLLKFSSTCLPVYSYIPAPVVTFIVRVYINLYLFLRLFFMSQRICTHCAHNRPIHEFFDSNSTRVLNLCSSLFTDLPVYSYTLYASYMLHSTC